MRDARCAMRVWRSVWFRTDFAETSMAAVVSSHNGDSGRRSLAFLREPEPVDARCQMGA
jgi:hypothetical protein